MTANDDGVVLVDLDLTCLTELIDGGFLEVETQLVADHLTAGEDGDVAEHFFSSVAKARSLDSRAGEGAAELVQNERGECFAFYVLSDDEQLLACLYDLFQQRQDVLHVGDLLVGDEYERVVENGFHLIGVGSHVRRQVASVELHTFDHFAVGFSGLGFLHGDHAVGGDLFHSVRDEGTDHFVAGGYGADAGDVFLAGYCLGVCLQSGNRFIDCLLDALADDHRIGTGCNVLHAFVDEGLCEQGSGGGAVAGCVVRLGSDLADELCAHVFACVLQLDLLRDGHAVVGDQRSAVLLIENHVSALRAHGDLNSIRKFIHACDQRVSGIYAVYDILSHNAMLLIE